MRSIDLHAHILPGVDDGPATIEGALELALAAVAAGTSRLVATPHVNEDRLIAPADIGPAVDALNARLRAEEIALEVLPGGEVALSRVLDLTRAELHGLGLGGGPYLLLESPLAVVAGDFEPLVHDVMANGQRVLLAHPERSPTFQREPDRLAALVAAGALVQITAAALTGGFGNRVRQFTERLMRDDLVHVISSDAHDNLRRPPGMDEALAAAERAIPGIAARANWYVHDVPAAILAGDPIPEPAPLPSASSGRSRGGAWRRRLVARASR